MAALVRLEHAVSGLPQGLVVVRCCGPAAMRSREAIVLSHRRVRRGRRIRRRRIESAVPNRRALGWPSSVVMNDLSLRARCGDDGAEANGVRVRRSAPTSSAASPPTISSPGDCVMVGDVLYDPDVARRMLPWLQRLAAFGVAGYGGRRGRSPRNISESMELLEEVELPAADAVGGVRPGRTSVAVRAGVWRMRSRPANPR